MKVNNKKSVYYSVLHCSCCNMQMVIPRLNAHKREINHIKTMYCAKCQKTTDFIETEQALNV